MIPLVEAASGTLRSLLPPGLLRSSAPSEAAVSWYAALAAEIAHHLSPAHAELLARPKPVDGGMTWLAEGTARTRYADLPAMERRALDAAVGAILSDIRRLAESGAAPIVRDAWPALIEIPDIGHLFAVDGRPVLAAWGHAGSGASGRLLRLDDGVPWRATPLRPWSRYGAALGVLAGLALAAGLLLPMTPHWFVGQPAACAIVPGQLDALRGQMELDGRGQELRTLLATLTEEVGRAQLLCPVAVVPQAAAPAPRPLPALPPHADLPQDRWDRHDLAMLEGCWNLYTAITVFNEDRTQGSKIRNWRQCFDGHGAGRQTIALEDGLQCEGALAASFDPNATLRVTEPTACHGTFHLFRSERLCRRLGDAEAECSGRTVEGSNSGHNYTGRFRR